MPGDDDQSPWWSANDPSYQDASPLFEQSQQESQASDDHSPDDKAREETSHDSSPNEEESSSHARQAFPPQSDNPFAEAMKFAAAVAAWSEATGLTETLKDIAHEASEALAEQSPPESASASSTPHAAASDNASSTCDYCPICRGVEVMKVVKPQVSEGAIEVLSSLTAAMNSALRAFQDDNR